MGRSRNTMTAAATSTPLARRGAKERPKLPVKGSHLVKDGKVSIKDIDAAGSHGASTGIWFHVTAQERADVMREDGIQPSHKVTREGQMHWVDPHAVYLWPTLEAAKEWSSQRSRGEYHGSRIGDKYEVLNVNARSDESFFAPDNEDFSMLVALWSGEHYSGEGWPEEYGFERDMMEVSADEVSLRSWLEAEGDKHYWGDDEESDEDEDEEPVDERLVASQMVRAMPKPLRLALVEYYSKAGRPVMVLSPIPANRLVDIED